jgi:omega-6 fatty acid desaturase (delta-12 desaturase)
MLSQRRLAAPGRRSKRAILFLPLAVKARNSIRKPSLHAPIPAQSAEPDPHALFRQLRPYRQADSRRSAFELAVTAGAFALSWLLLYATLRAGYMAGLLLAVPAGGFLLRLFLIQHDCGHGAFFRRSASNDWVGRMLGVITLTPFDDWRRSHAAHHAGTGNLDARGTGDIDTLTVREFRSRSPMRRLLYRLYRNPIVLFGLGPAYQFLLRHRLPIGMKGHGWRPWVSTLGTNAGILVIVAAISWAIGFKLFLLVHLPIAIVAATLGMWLFYVQHQFERTEWDRGEEWSFHRAALFGSSHYALPTILRWFSANIGIHHVHHLASRIPFYRLNEAMRDLPMLATVNTVRIGESLRSVRLVLWDEETRRLVSFGDARA